jgi:HicA-like toxin of HicAB toxin-antitoxin system
MPALGPTKRQDLIRGLHQCGFDGPFSGGKHQFMKRGSLKLPIPNPHQGDISVSLLKRILAKAGVPEDDWERM